MKNTLILGLMTTTLFLATGCAKTNSDADAVEDTSASGAAAAAAGGALSTSNSSGTLASAKKPSLLQQSFGTAYSWIPDASASTACPTFATTGAACSASGSRLWLNYAACSFGNSNATWTGTQLLQMSSGSAACGTFPNPGASATLTRQFVTAASSTTPSSVTRTNAFGTTVTLDDATSNLGNFDSQTIATLANGGYGTQVTFNGSGARSAVTLARKVSVSTRFSHSISGSLTVTESASSSTSRVLSGSIKVFHNLLKVVGTSRFDNVTHSNTCCVPVSGSVTTTFAAGSNVSPSIAGALVVGKSETLTFTGCGTASLQAADGTTASVSLSSCF